MEGVIGRGCVWVEEYVSLSLSLSLWRHQSGTNRMAEQGVSRSEGSNKTLALLVSTRKDINLHSITLLKKSMISFRVTTLDSLSLSSFFSLYPSLALSLSYLFLSYFLCLSHSHSFLPHASAVYEHTHTHTNTFVSGGQIKSCMKQPISTMMFY